MAGGASLIIWVCRWLYVWGPTCFVFLLFYLLEAVDICMQMHAFKCMHAYKFMHACTYTNGAYMHACICMHVYKWCVHACIQMHACMQMLVDACKCMHANACMQMVHACIVYYQDKKGVGGRHWALGLKEGERRSSPNRVLIRCLNPESSSLLLRPRCSSVCSRCSNSNISAARGPSWGPTAAAAAANTSRRSGASRGPVVKR